MKEALITFLKNNKIKIKKALKVVLPLLVLYFSLINFTEPTELGIARNFITGNTWPQVPSGWHLTSPFVRVAVIDTRPIRVSVLSAGKGFDSKLIQFNPKEWLEFINTEGFYYYWWANRFSFNLGYKEEHRGFRDIMRGYAYSKKKYSFIKIIAEFEEE